MTYPTGASLGADSTQGSPPPAATQVVEALQAVLTDLVDLHLQAKQVHWNVVGPNFRGLHLQLDEVVDVARDGADAVAERVRAIGGTPDGRTATVSRATTLSAMPAGKVPTSQAGQLVVDAITAVTTTIAGRHDTVDAHDPASADLLHQLTLDLDKQAWMLRAESSERG
jgi:starvation-inducible DNA-binding protein